ncbi:RnfABCDGE type electron transport complex subunit B [Paenalcaligenes niemegkensis]|uniref:RnfABCDGE type electron transport complex subunit B n=1 Tax=Paenalcaligenes niemegkensis TaxID=2895469 RepID=UPI001EE8ACF8|nr:RnfABCDGE type electron transport complex subunit B [Paenalcaligenes niemegkensis]MCQ9616905.1 RnfABCDGE type electron transport complex subunit B [Paenalcaligenes niemegkensis]
MSLVSLTDRINQLLPQTQCTRCGYDACKPYAQAIAEQGELINRCPPGGPEGIAALAKLTGQAAIALNKDCGEFKPQTVAVIDEAHCIGCTLCIQACPVDAIVGANKLMHTVIADQCSGCDLCIAPCPVDCIVMVESDPWTDAQAEKARLNFERRQERLANRHGEDNLLANRVLANKPEVALAADEPERRKASIADALARARERRANHRTT